MTFRELYKRLHNHRQERYTPLFLFTCAAGFIGGAIGLLLDGEFPFHWSGTTTTLVRPDAHPLMFWGILSAFFISGLLCAGAGVIILRIYLRQRSEYRSGTHAT